MMKQLQFLVLLLIIIFTISCDDKIKKPDNLISENEMVDILTDLSLLNAAQGLNKKILVENGILSEKYVFKKHNIDSLQFVTSNSYYAHNIKVYERIYAKLKANLNAKKTEYKKREEEEAIARKLKDSLQKIEKNKALDNSESNPISIENIKAPGKIKDPLKKVDSPPQ